MPGDTGDGLVPRDAPAVRLRLNRVGSRPKEEGDGTMRVHRLTTNEAVKALGVGIATAILLSVVMVPLFKLGVSPLPKPLGLAFAETVLGRPLPLPVGLLFHLVYVTAWSAAYVALFRDDLSFRRALMLGVLLWIVVLIVFFPVVGWGFLGLGISPKVIPASLAPHLLFAVFVWGLCRIVFARRAEPGA